MFNGISQIIALLFTHDTPSPKNRIPKEAIRFTNTPDGKSEVVIEGLPKGCRVGTTADTNSMSGLIDFGHDPILCPIFDIGDLQVGDVIVYEKFPRWICHQIVGIGTDKRGWYCRCKGVNNFFIDRSIIREKHIKHLVLFVIW